MNNKVCYLCKQNKSLDDFTFSKNMYGNPLRLKNGKIQYYSYCKKCSSLRYKGYYAKEVGKDIKDIGRYKRVEIINGKMCCRICNIWKLLCEFYKGTNIYGYGYDCKDCSNIRGKEFRKKQKIEFINAYGGCCQCCGESEISFLTIEHIRNSGNKLIYAAKYTLISRLKRLGWPDEYTCLCYNCNMSTKEYGTICIHKINISVEA